MEFVETLNTSTSHRRTTRMLLLQMLLSCTGLHSYDPTDRKSACKPRSESHERWIIRNGQEYSPDSDLPQLVARVIVNAADPTPRTNGKREKRFRREIVEKEAVNVILGGSQSVPKRRQFW